MIEMPLTNDPEQLFSLTLNDELFKFRVLLNARTTSSSNWTMNITRGDGTEINGLALTGSVDIFTPYNIPIKNAYVVNLDNPNLDPTKTNLGTIAKLFILTDEEFTNATTL